MLEYKPNTCKICSRSNDYCKIFESSQYLNVYNKIFNNTECQLGLWLCFWCRSVFKKVNDLIGIAKICGSFLPGDKAVKTNLIINNLSYLHNAHIDIPPVEANIEKDIKEEEFEIKDINTEFINKENIQRSKQYIKRNSLKKDKLEELNFDVNYLSINEQKEDVEDKKRSERYTRWSYKCQHCGVGFFFKDDYVQHEKRHMKISGPYACDICHLRFRTAEVLSQHTLAHRRRFTCRSCGSKFKRWSHCIAHRFKCGTNATPLACDICAKIFGDRHSLKVHIKTVHASKKKYACDQCNKSFATKQRLTVHIRSHTGVKPFACASCSRSFATGSNLRAHAAVHSHSKDHYCVECDKYFKTEKSLKRHYTEALKHAAGDVSYSPTMRT